MAIVRFLVACGESTEGVGVRIALFTLVLLCTSARADDAQWHEWFSSLFSPSGTPCCAQYDGIVLTDVDWDHTLGHGYRVFVEGQWVDVPDSAVVRAKNKFGRAVVWPYRDGAGVLHIRCFLPGAES